LLHGNLAAELVLLGFLLLQDRVAPGLEGAEPLIHGAGDAAVEPHGRARDPLEQPTIVADQHDPGARAGQLALQPFDAGEVRDGSSAPRAAGCRVTKTRAEPARCGVPLRRTAPRDLPRRKGRVP